MNDAEQVAFAVATLVRGVERFAGGEREIRGDAEIHQLALLAEAMHGRAERLAADVVHRDEEAIAFLTDLVDLHDVRMADARSDARFVEEHAHEARLPREVLVDRLDRDQAFEAAEPE